MRRSKSDPSKYARNYRSISQRRMTQYNDNAESEEKEMERLRAIIRNSELRVEQSKQQQQQEEEEEDNINNKIRNGISCKKRRKGDSDDDNDNGSTDVVDGNDNNECYYSSTTTENPLIIIPSSKKKKKKKGATTKATAILTPYEIKQAKLLQKNTTRKLQQLELRSKQKQKRKELYKQLEKNAQNVPDKDCLLPLLSSSSTLSRKRGKKNNIHGSLSKKQTLQRLLQKERAGITLTKEEKQLLYPTKEVNEEEVDLDYQEQSNDNDGDGGDHQKEENEGGEEEDYTKSDTKKNKKKMKKKRKLQQQQAEQDEQNNDDSKQDNTPSKKKKKTEKRSSNASGSGDDDNDDKMKDESSSLSSSGGSSRTKQKQQKKQKKDKKDDHDDDDEEEDNIASSTTGEDESDKLSEAAAATTTTTNPSTTASTSTSTTGFAAMMMASLSKLKQETIEKKQQQQHDEDEGSDNGDEDIVDNKQKRYVPTNPTILKTAGKLGIQDSQQLQQQRPGQQGNRTKVVRINRPDSIEQSRYDLPVSAMEFEIVDAIRNNDVTIICGETGSGKSTQVCQFLYEAGFSSPRNHHHYQQQKQVGPSTNDIRDEKPLLIGITQPRRVAAVSTAKRVCYEMGHGDGQSIRNNSKNNKGDGRGGTGNLVGYKTRYESAGVGSNTNLLFATDGILLQEIQDDLLLRKYSVIILDETHERNLNTDVLIGLLSLALPLRKKAAEEDMNLVPLKLVLMSATLRVEDFTKNTKLFPSCTPAVIRVPGRTFPVTIHHSKVTELEDYGKL